MRLASTNSGSRPVNADVAFKEATGFNAGIDVSRALTSHVAVGGIIRYSRATVRFDDSEVGKHTIKTGGVETLAGVRFRF